MIAEEECRVIYALNAGVKEFPIPFRFIRAEHIHVYHDGSEEYVQGREYLVSGVSENGGKSYASGTVVFGEAPDKVIAIVRRVPYEQTTDYVVNGDLPAETLEGDFDYAMMIAQQLEDALKRCIRIAETSEEDPEEVLRKLKALAGNSDIIQASKDICVNSATAAANSAASAALCQTFIASVMSELTNDPSYLQGAISVLQEVSEAAGAVETAAEIALGNIDKRTDEAVAAVAAAAETVKTDTQAQLTDMAESNLLTATQQLTAEISAAVGSDGVFQAALAAAKGDLNEDVEAALTRAEGIFDGYVNDARDTVTAAIADWEQIKAQALAEGNAALAALAESKLAALTEIQTKVTEASGFSTSAFGFSQTALTAKNDALTALAGAQEAARNAANSEAAALAYKNDINGVVNESLTAHNASMASHAAGFNHNILIQKVMSNGDRYEVVLNNNGAGQNFHIWLDSTKNGVTSRVFPFYFSIDTGAVTIGTELHVGNAYINTIKSGLTVEGLLQSRNLELWAATVTSNNGGYIDFHYNRASSDYTARIIEDSSGTIHVLNNIKTGNVTATGNVTVTGLVTSGADALRLDYGDYKVWLRRDSGNFYILLSDAGGSTWNGKRPLTIDLPSGRINLQKRPYYSGETDITSAWSGGSWTATGDGWLIVGMGRSSGAWTLRNSNGKVIAHVGKNDSGAVMTAYPIPINEGERYTIYAATTGYQTLAAVDDTKKTAPAWAYYVPGNGA